MNCPLPRYYLCHSAVALIITLLLWWPIGIEAGLAAGVAFYAGREFTQWEQGGGSGLPFDWMGILTPLASSLIFLAAYSLL